MVATSKDANYDSDDTRGLQFQHKIFNIFGRIRESRLGNVNSILAVSEVSHLKNILIIVPDDEFGEWKTNFARQAAKDVRHTIFYHETALSRLMENKYSYYPERFESYKAAKITLSKYSVISKENEQLERDDGTSAFGSRGQYEFFTKHWSLIIFHSAEQVEDKDEDSVAVKAANAALQLQSVSTGKRVFVFSRAFLNLTPFRKRRYLAGDRFGKRPRTKGNDNVTSKRARRNSVGSSFMRDSPTVSESSNSSSIQSDTDGSEDVNARVKKVRRGGNAKGSKAKTSSIKSDDEEADDEDDSNADETQDEDEDEDEDDDDEDEDGDGRRKAGEGAKDNLNETHISDDDEETGNGVDMMAAFYAWLNHSHTYQAPYLRISGDAVGADYIAQGQGRASSVKPSKHPAMFDSQPSVQKTIRSLPE